MAIKSITWHVSYYSLTYHNPHSRKTITKTFDREEDLIKFINSHPKINEFGWKANKHGHIEIEEE